MTLGREEGRGNPRPQCRCGEVCMCLCHVIKADHVGPCCGEGSSAHDIYCKKDTE